MTQTPMRAEVREPRPPILKLTRVLAVAPLLMMVASDYKLRQRTISDSLGGRPDVTVVVEALVYGLVGLYLIVAYTRRPRSVKVSAPLLCLWAFGITMMVSALLAPFPVLASVRAAQLIVMCLLASVLSSVATPRLVRNTVHLFMILIAVSSVYGMMFPHQAVTRLTAGRFTWLYVHPIISGEYLSIAMIIALALALEPASKRRWPRGAYVLLTVLFTVSLLRTETRGSVAAAAVGALVVGLVSARRETRAKRLLGIATGVLLFGLVASSAIERYIARGEDTAKLGTLNSRTELWGQAWHFFTQRPLSGWGLGSTRGLFLQTIGLGGAHNAFVNVLVDGGIAGVIWWLATLVTLLVAARRLVFNARWRDQAPLIGGILAVLLVNALTVEGLGSSANVASIWLVLLVGWVVAASRPGQREPPRPVAALGPSPALGDSSRSS